MTQLVRHLPDHVVREALGCIPQLSTVVAPHYKAGYPGKIFDAQKRAMLVSDVVGLAVPAMYEHRTMEDGDFTLRREAVTLLALRKQPKLVVRFWRTAGRRTVATACRVCRVCRHDDRAYGNKT